MKMAKRKMSQWELQQLLSMKASGQLSEHDESGEGSGGGGSARARRARYEEETAKMPELQGTEKQVKLAEQIRSEFLKSADSAVKNAEQRAALNQKPDGRTVMSVKAAQTVRKDVISTMQQVTSAAQIIELRKSLTYQAIEQRAFAWDRERKK